MQKSSSVIKIIYIASTDKYTAKLNSLYPSMKISEAELELFTRRKEEGYDLYDEQYLRWKEQKVIDLIQP